MFKGLKKHYREDSITLSDYALGVERKKRGFVKYSTGILFMLPYLAMFVTFFLYPLVFGIIISLFKYNIANPVLDETTWRGFLNFQKLFTTSTSYGKDFWNGMRITLLFVVILVPCTIIIPLGLALLVNMKPPGSGFFRTMLYISSIFPQTATGVIFLNMFNPNYGFFNSFFHSSINWLSDPTYNTILIIVFTIWAGCGGNFLIFYAALQNCDPSLNEAAAIDGCRGFKRVLFVKLPQIKPQLVMCLFNTTIGMMNFYGQVYMLGAYQIDESVKKTVIYVIQNLITGTNFEVYGMVSAMAILLGFFIAAISITQLIVTKERKGGNKHAKQYKEALERL